MMQAQTLERNSAEDRAQWKIVMPLAVPLLAAVRAALLRRHPVGGLMFDDNLLDISQNGFAFGQAQAQCLQLQFRPVHGDELVYLLLPVVSDRDDPDFEDHAAS